LLEFENPKRGQFSSCLNSQLMMAANREAVVFATNHPADEERHFARLR